MNNPLARLRALLKPEAVQAGDVAAIHADGTRTVTLTGGGTLRVTGSAAVGERVLVRGGRIEAVTGALNTVELEV